MIHVEEVTKRYGHVLALRGVSLQLRQGRCLGIFGPNGAGKTTLLKILSTLTRPSTGSVSIAGYDTVRQADKIRPLLGVLSHQSFLYGHLTAMENLQFYGRLFGVKNLPERVAEMLEAVGLEMHAHRLVRTYSRGMQQRLAIARVLLHCPPIILLDEPYTGLDQQAVLHVQELLQQSHAPNRTIILSTHDLQRGLELYDDIAIQCHGKIVYYGSALGIDSRSLEQLYVTHIGA
jgi:heme ABC exporter ATP-binding subunit CcmA